MRKKVVKIIFIFFSAIFFGCGQFNSSETKPLNNSIEEFGFGSERDKKFVEGEDNEECIFDQETQTDDFLKGIEELEGYVWNKLTKMAEISLDDQWNLTIFRGGCDVFTLATLFSYNRRIVFEKEKDIILKKIIWISSLLDDLDYELIKETIELNQLNVTKESRDNYFINFMNKDMYESYVLDIELGDNNTYFSFTYVIN